MARIVAAARQGGGAQLRADTGRWTIARRGEFLAMLAQTANVRLAVRSVGMSEQGVYKLRARDPAFARAWGEALCQGYDKLEMLMLQRALAGMADEPVDPGDGGRAAMLSERAILTLMQQHRQTVRDLRAAAAAGGDPDARDDGSVHARLEAKLAAMHARLVDGDAE